MRIHLYGEQVNRCDVHDRRPSGWGEAQIDALGVEREAWHVLLQEAGLDRGALGRCTGLGKGGIEQRLVMPKGVDAAKV